MTTGTMESFGVPTTISSFLNRTHGLLINNDWRTAASGKTFDVHDPATGEVLTRVAEGDKEDIDRAVAAARRSFDEGPWRNTTASDRGRLIWRLADVVEEHSDEFAYLESLDNGKPLTVAKGADVPLAVDTLRYMAGLATKLEGRTIPISVPYAPGARFFACTMREPVGVVGQIIPWNFPLLMAVWKLGPALAAGCTVVLKPAEQTPLSAIRLGELILEVGFPPGVVNIVSGLGETAGAALAAHPFVDKVAFTGSTEVGKSIVRAAAGNLKKLTLELGGKSPNIVFADADLESAIAGAADAIFFNHGQCCCAGSRLYVEKPVFDEVVQGIANKGSAIRLGPGLDPKTEMGPLVSKEQIERVCRYVRGGIDRGAVAVTGGQRGSQSGYFMNPTVLINASQEMDVVQEEIFGPVIVALPFEEESIIPTANDTTYGLAAGVWTGKMQKALRTASRLKAGTVWINSYNVFDPALPFGGYKESGWGREMGSASLDPYTEIKSLVSPM